MKRENGTLLETFETSGKVNAEQDMDSFASITTRCKVDRPAFDK